MFIIIRRRFCQQLSSAISNNLSLIGVNSNKTNLLLLVVKSGRLGCLTTSIQKYFNSADLEVDRFNKVRTFVGAKEKYGNHIIN